MIYDPIPFVKLVQKILVGNYEHIMGIWGKIFIINLHNLQMLRTKYKFLECVAPLHNMKAPNFCCAQKNMFQTYHKNKYFPPENAFSSQTLKLGYGPDSAKNASAIRVFALKTIRPVTWRRKRFFL